MSERSVVRRVTAADIARSVGVSRATVGFVLNDTPGQTISEPTRRKVLAAAERLGYRPHSAARALASGQSRIVLLVLPDWPIEFSMSAHLAEASLVLDEAGFSLVTWTPHESGRARPLWEILQPDVVIGLQEFTADERRAIERSGARVAGQEPIGTWDESVGVFQGPELQIEHLARRGHRRLLFAGTTDRRLSELSRQRGAGARMTAAQLGLTLHTAPVDEQGELPDVREWVGDGITGVAACNDTIAATVVGAALRAGLSVPGDLAVIGHDDAPVARLMVPSISTIYLDFAGIGRHLAELALQVATGSPAPQQSPSLTARLIQRETT